MIQNILNLKSTTKTEVLCPVCQFNYNHLEEVIAVCGSNDDSVSTHAVSINAKSEIKVHPETLSHGYRLRGLGVIITFTCENDHLWYKTFMFHKGNTFEENISEDK